MRKVLQAVILVALFVTATTFRASFVEAVLKPLHGSEPTGKEAVPQIVRFVGGTGGVCADVAVINAAEQEALAKANVWIRNTPRIRIISLSVAGNYYGGMCTLGYTSVSILYEAR